MIGRAQRVMTLMRRATAILCSAAIVIAAGLAGADDHRINLFSGTLDAVDIGSWGSGTIEIDEDETYLDGQALVVNTTGFFEGGRLDLREPVAAERLMTNPEGGYLRLVVKVHEPEPARPERPDEMFPGARDDFPFEPGMDPDFAPPPGDWVEEDMHHPGPDFHEPGMWDEMDIARPPAPPEKIEQLRVVLVSEEGAVDSGPISLEEFVEIVDDWKQIVIPMTAFRGPVDISDGEIRQIALFGNTEEKFYVGEVALGYEEQPLVADAGERQRTVRVNEEVQFEAAPQPEGVSATYTWDFDHLDGIQEEGYGREATWTFMTPGFYVVTLTVTDPEGRKVDRIDRVHVQVVE